MANELAAAIVRRQGAPEAILAVALGEYAGEPDAEVAIVAAARDAMHLTDHYPDAGVLRDILRAMGSHDRRRAALRGALGLGSPADRELAIALSAASICPPCLAEECDACSGSTAVHRGRTRHVVYCICAGERHPESLPDPGGPR